MVPTINAAAATAAAKADRIIIESPLWPPRRVVGAVGQKAELTGRIQRSIVPQSLFMPEGGGGVHPGRAANGDRARHDHEQGEAAGDLEERGRRAGVDAGRS